MFFGPEAEAVLSAVLRRGVAMELYWYVDSEALGRLVVVSDPVLAGEHTINSHGFTNINRPTQHNGNVAV